ncbi:MAG TPA: ATP/GTP-binding protein [Dermatophilaceae bacterium]|nr:ATP/GTP-binding protein [Dermatophilaceae bacterium]
MAFEDDLVDYPVARAVRSFTLTGGRTRPTVAFPVEATIELLPTGQRHWPDTPLGRVARSCHHRSIAEISAYEALRSVSSGSWSAIWPPRASSRSNRPCPPPRRPTIADRSSKGPSVVSATSRVASTKIVVSGAFGVGKTTLVGTISEIVPLRTEALVTDESTHVDDLSVTPDKGTTTVAMDFGKITLAEDLVLYLFGTPGQQRFWFMWDDLCVGAIGAVVLVDPARLDDAFAPIDYFEGKQIPFVVAVNHFEGSHRYPLLEIASALALPPGTPILEVDARNREMVKRVLIRVAEYALITAMQAEEAEPVGV